MSTRKYVEVPDEFTGKPLEAKVTSITHAYKYIDIFLEISLPGDAGSVPYKKRLWSRIPNNSKTDFSKQNDASLHLWRTILGIPESVTNTQLVEKIDTLAMLDLLEYRLEVSMETSEEGRKFLKVISYDAVPIDWYNMCRKYREALMEIESLEQKADYQSRVIDDLNRRKGKSSPAVEAETHEEKPVPAVYPWASPWGTETVGDFIKDDDNESVGNYV